MLANCSAHRYAINKARMVRVTEYSRQALHELREATGIQYEGRQLGTLQLFRTQQQVDASARDIEVLQRYGVPCELLDRAGIVALEPALADAPVPLVGALRRRWTRPAIATCSPPGWPRWRRTPAWSSATAPASKPSRATGRRSPACASTARWKPPTATCLRWAASRRRCSPRSASDCRYIR
jgi:hypothetical protein